MRKHETEPIDTGSLRDNLRVIVVKDMLDFWIVMCSSDMAMKFEESKNVNGENLYPWPQGAAEPNPVFEALRTTLEKDAHPDGRVDP